RDSPGRPRRYWRRKFEPTLGRFRPPRNGLWRDCPSQYNDRRRRGDVCPAAARNAALELHDRERHLFVVQVLGLSGMNCSIEGSHNLESWSTLGSVPLPTGGAATFTDNQASGYPYRFYRARSYS